MITETIEAEAEGCSCHGTHAERPIDAGPVAYFSACTVEERTIRLRDALRDTALAGKELVARVGFLERSCTILAWLVLVQWAALAGLLVAFFS